MSENSVATMVPRHPAPYSTTFHFADPIAIGFPEGPPAGGYKEQSLEWHILPMAVDGTESCTVSKLSIAAFPQNHFSMQSVGTQTSPKLALSPSRRDAHDASTSPVNFLPGAPSEMGTRGPPSRTSAMDFLDLAALCLEDLTPLSHLPSLRKTAQDLLADPSDPGADMEGESEQKGVQGRRIRWSILWQGICV